MKRKARKTALNLNYEVRLSDAIELNVGQNQSKDISEITVI